MHQRQQIRDAVAARLLAASTAAGSNVFTSRARPILEILQRKEAVLSVYTGDETSRRSPDGHLLDRTLTVSIEGAAGGGDDLDDVLDDFAQEVEAALDADPTLGGLLHDDLELTATSSEISARGNVQVGAFRMDYECRYLTQRIDPGEPGVLPTEVIITGTPTPQAYVQPLDDARMDPPAIVPADVAQAVPSQPPLAATSVCVDGSCDVPAWQGD